MQRYCSAAFGWYSEGMANSINFEREVKTMALNKVIIMGRITNDLEVRQTPSGLAILRFTVAVDAGKDKPAYFIDCVAWKSNAEFINNYFGKGRMIAIEGKLSTRTWEDKQGNKRKAVEVIVDSASFTGERSQTNGNTPQSGFSGQGYNRTSQVVAEPNNGNSVDLTDFEDADVLSEDGIPF